MNISLEYTAVHIFVKELAVKFNDRFFYSTVLVYIQRLTISFAKVKSAKLDKMFFEICPSYTKIT